MITFYYLPSSQNICVSVFDTVMLLFLFMGISSDASSVNRTSANCSEWFPVNVTDEWLSFGAQCNAPRVWRCNETSHERLLLLVDCTESKDIGKIQNTDKSTHDILLIFLYGTACGSGGLILIILLLSTVSCCLKKQRRKRSHGERRASTQETRDYITTACNPLEEKQNETRQESSVQTSMPEPFMTDFARDNDDEELEYAEPFERSHQDVKKPLKLQKHPLNGNSHNKEKMYMHLIPETRQRDETSNLTTKSPKRSRRKQKEACATKPRLSVKLRELTKKPTSTRTDVRPLSAAYVNGHLAKIYSNVP